jgi:hypothetical protein
MVKLAVGTKKGAFILDGNGDGWDLTGPLHAGWQVTTFGRAPGGDHLLATGSDWYGAALHRSPDLEEWEQIVDGPAWPEGGDRKMQSVWTVVRSGDTLWAGVSEAGLFRSDDDGATWHGVPAFNEHATRSGWQPGAGGLAAHRILIDPSDHRRLWVGVSAVGVFYSGDGGESWELRNEGVERTAADDDHEEIGYCVHRIAHDPDAPDRIWRQDHKGVYRTADGGASWERIEEGLPSGFGFPVVRDDASGALFVAPQESDQRRMPTGGRFRVFRSTDDGDSWHESGTGHPEEGFYGGVLRDAMDADGDGGVYLGTTSGTVHVTADGGDSWEILPQVFPRVLSVKVIDA